MLVVPLAALLVFLLFSPPPLPAQTNVPAQNPSAQQKQLCSIAGTVVRTGTGEPVRKAKVILTPDDRKASSAVVAYTDAAGRFSIDLVPPGVYGLEVARTDYISQSYGESGASHSPSDLTLRPGQNMLDLLFRLVPAGVILGRVFDPDGDPVEGAEVVVMRQTFKKGKSKLATQQETRTNDLGEYRISGLDPGRYFVRAVIPDPYIESGDLRVVGASSSSLAHGPAYYPAATDSSRATLLDIAPGSEVSGIDITLTHSARFRVRGRVTNSVSGKSGGTMFVHAVRKDLEDRNPRATMVDDKIGEFSLAELSPGIYTITAILHDEGKQFTGQREVEITNADVDGVQIVIAAGVDVVGRLLTEGKSASQADNITILLSADEFSFSGRGPTHPKTNGSFMLNDVQAGLHQIQVYSACDICYLKSAQSGGEDILAKGLEVAPGATPAPLELVYSSNSGAVDGTVTRDDGLPAFGATVLLVPDPPLPMRVGRFGHSGTDQYGHFLARGIAPGKYKALAGEQIELESYNDPDFLASVEKDGVSVEISENEKKTLQLKLIPGETDKSSK